MKNIIKETEAIAYGYLKEFGFKDEQITPLVTMGKRDLNKELSKLKDLLADDVVVIDDVNNVLHALKGLLFQLGNHTLADQLNEIRSQLDSKVALKEISEVLFDA